MSAGLIGFVAFLFIGFTWINRMLEGAMIAVGDVTILNQVSVFRNLQLFGVFNVPVPNINFITQGIPHLMKWDYSFFSGNAGIFSYFLYALTAMISFGLFITMLGVIYSTFNRAR
jgi:hypothetical protein